MRLSELEDDRYRLTNWEYMIVACMPDYLRNHIAGEFHDLHGELRRPLIAGGYWSRRAVRDAPDAELLSVCRGLGPKRLRAVRKVIGP